MTNQKTIKELKKEIKDIEKRTYTLKAEKLSIENKGCFSDKELNERDKKIKIINKEIDYLNNEKKLISESIISMEGEKWRKQRGFQ